MDDEETALRLHRAVSWRGVLVSGLGLIVQQLANWLDMETRYLKSAMPAEDLGELHALLNAGIVTVPCLIAIRSALAATNSPIESRMGKKQGVMVLTSKYIETFDPRPDRSAVQSRDSVQNFLEVADSWNITDGVSHSLAVSRDVHCNSAPFTHSAYDRTVLHQGLLRAVATEAINYILQRKTPVASVVHEQYMPVHEQVALVGELRRVPQGTSLRPLTSKSIRPLQGNDGGNGILGHNNTRSMLAVMPPQHAKMNAKRKVLVTRDLEELTGGMTSLSVLCSVVGKGLLGAGLFMMARKFWRHYRRWQRVKREADVERQRRLRQARNVADDPDMLRSSMGECTICMSRPCNSTFPCGHMCACYLCALNLNQCPICRRRGEPIRLFPSGPE